DLPDMAVLVRRAVAAGALSAHSLAQAVKNGELGLAEALNLGGAQLRSDVIWSLAGNWRLGDARPTLSELVVLLPTVGNWDGDLALHHSDLEHLAWAVDQDSAVESGLCDLFEGRLARPGRDVLAGYLLHPAFAGRWSSPSPGQEAFRTWLAERITPLIAADSGLVAAISRGLADAETYARLRPVAHRLAAVATGDSIVSLCAWEDVADWVVLRDFVAAFLAAAPNADDPDLPFVVTLAARLDATDESRLGPRDLKDMARRHMRKGLS
ncbi:MAG TPA: hypothetical protein VF495_00980, partial [Phenylobacterium sp.]